MGLRSPAARLPVVIVAILVMMFGVLSYRSAVKHSPTIDEPLHAVAAYRAVFDADFRMNVEDPPLWKYWAMLPHLRTELRPADTDAIDPASGGFLIASRQLFQTPGNDGGGFINRSRMAMLVLGILLGIALACWGWQLAGPVGAITACGLFAFDPNFLAHSPLVKNDVAVSLVLFCVAWATWSVGRQVRWWNVILLAMLCAMAATIKFSGLLAAPIVVLLLLPRAWTCEPWMALGITLKSRFSRIVAVAGMCAVCFATAWITIWACYAFQFPASADENLAANINAQIIQLQRNGYFLAHGEYPTQQQISSLPIPLIARVVRHMYDHHCLPESYLVGGLLTWAASLVRHSYLLGELSMTGWWYYFPLAMLFKTPLTTLAAMILSALSTILFRRQQRRETWTAACILIPLLTYGLFALTTNLNIGLRHILPIYPFIYMLIGIAAARLHVAAPRAFKLLATVLSIGLILESLLAYPHYISYFNAAARPYRLTLLSDSNLDWGQDLTYVAQWQKANPSTPLYLAYWGPADPGFYGVHYTNLPGGFALGRNEPPPDMSKPGVVMVSATILQGVNQPDAIRAYYAPLRERAPDGMIGDSICLFGWKPRGSP